MDSVVDDKIKGIDMLADELISNCEILIDEDGNMHHIIEVEKVNIVATRIKRYLKDGLKI